MEPSFQSISSEEFLKTDFQLWVKKKKKNPCYIEKGIGYNKLRKLYL